MLEFKVNPDFKKTIETKSKSGKAGFPINPKIADKIKISASYYNGLDVDELMDILKTSDTSARGQARDTARGLGYPLYWMTDPQRYFSMPYENTENGKKEFEQNLKNFKKYSDSLGQVIKQDKQAHKHTPPEILKIVNSVI